MLPAGELARHFNLGNPRAHPEAQREATEGSLDTVGWIDEISLSTNGDGPASLEENPDAVMFDGHERIEIVLARFGPDAPVPVKWYQLSKEETDFALLVKDQTSAMAELIPEKMAALMERAKALTAAPGLQIMLMQLKQRVSDMIVDDPMGEWKGMPEFENTPTAYRTIYVHFKTEEDVNNFFEIINQKRIDKIKYVWYPEREASERVLFIDES